VYWPRDPPQRLVVDPLAGEHRIRFRLHPREHLGMLELDPEYRPVLAVAP
jgi:hypothetical protein